MSTQTAAAASEGHVAQAARDALARGNAVDAVVTSLLVAAAHAPGVFLGPVQLLVGGAGAGLVAVDGRVRQPGLGIPRPRGVVGGEAVPPAARVGVPALPSALAAVLASTGTITLTRAVAPALEHARQASAERAAVLRAFGKRGVAAMTDDAIAGELVAVAGRAAGGALTTDDLVAVRPDVVPCDERRLADGVLRVPWTGTIPATESTHVVAASDRRGLLAIACYETALDGLAVPGLGLVAPAVASPVMRGEPRVRPGEALPAAAPMVLRARRGQAELALGIAAAQGAEAALEAVLATLGEEGPVFRTALEGAPGRPVAIVRTRDAARVLAG